MYVENGAIVTSPTDLSLWSACEWAVLRRLDTALGRAPQLDVDEDDMLVRTARLGDEHERRFLAELKEAHRVVEFERPERADYAAAADAAVAAMEAGVEVLYQATFFDGVFLGFSDFLLRTPDGAYEVYDTKLARHATIPALLQLAAYAEQIEARGVRVGPHVHLVLGDGSITSHELAVIAPVQRVQRARLRAVLEERVAAVEPLRWGDPRYASCGRCGVCAPEVRAHRDPILVAGLRLDQRAKLAAAGVTTIDGLASGRGPVPGLGAGALESLRAQARLQLATEAAPDGVPVVEVVDVSLLEALPAPDPGDVFFDFEGDPLFTQDGHEWGLDYLFGLVDVHERFTALWAHDLAGERRALIDFLALVRERRALHPGLHVYHYASYERAHLLSLARRHGVGEEEVDGLLREGVLVDLYPVVRRALRVGSPSYSLKKLEPLYMASETRDAAGVTTATDSITAYAEAAALLDGPREEEGRRRLAEIAEYNAYDCRSTLRLREWLLSLAPVREAPLPLVEVDLPVAREPDPIAVALLARVEGVRPHERTADQTALALAGAAIDYHRREAKTFWQEHFDRLRQPLDDWADARDVVVVERAEVVREWSKPPRARLFSREVRLLGRLAPGSRLRVGATPFLVYEASPPPGAPAPGPGLRGASERAEILEIHDVGEQVELLLKEGLKAGEEPHDDVPLALAPAPPPRATPQPEAIARWGGEVLDALPELMPDPALDVLRRRPPSSVVPVGGGDVADAVVRSLLAIERQALAVQGPPGTGKTFVGSQVIARLVAEHGWRVGVVGQSHSVVEHLLTTVVERGVDPTRVVKKPRSGVAAEALEALAWTPVADGAALASVLETEGGCVVGGTAWTFANEASVPRRSLDLLVIDEAGQFSLAPTIASAVAAKRILLLGDPQQLPQVSQGSHPEPVDASALGWLADGHDVLPPEYGYFLDKSYRLHPALAAAVSELSYQGALASCAPPERDLQGIAPGLHSAPVPHHGNTTSSPEEARRVVEIALSLVGRRWRDENGERLLTAADVIVVAPYNAQGGLLREALDAAGLRDTAVGTVDLFQGREAVAAIVSLAASSGADVPRGLEFLLLPHRLNVAISRAKWAAYLVHAPSLPTSAPTSLVSLERLSRFIRLLERAHHEET
ncbi:MULTISPECIES: TM0106 family RecB-like putative nuclease [unclassified Rathayibacter]|uniref:TM0106 family RecB-like putative nuclease n=1 Tax=unclassified Rathayibacter TaxID=2609250 RepID=UPI00188D6177|nr:MULTISPECIES: TM0106 family RecB-like putative nuclease [unclassified Rathayibacter]MBF4462896.1 TM0106 family RecB-like putative nuclease [Rathayibacter sp. VKM Ac-2879]MBF4504310.1 TM0106 family RecB-like putative nuclease [Rathayibacter sp. VKM Ac-2878]